MKIAIIVVSVIVVVIAIITKGFTYINGQLTSDATSLFWLIAGGLIFVPTVGLWLKKMERNGKLK